jgi:DNA gyrase inhibitor GyrI
MVFDTTDLEDIPVICASSPGSPEDVPGAAKRAWAALEALIPPRGRKAYGYWHADAKEYVACYSLEDTDDPEALGLGQRVILGGRYRRARLKGEDVHAQIGSTFGALAAEGAIDEERPWLEFYRRHDEVDLLVPVLK